MRITTAIASLLLTCLCSAQNQPSTPPSPVACRTYSVLSTNAAFIAKSSTPAVTLFTLPARSKVLGVTVEHSVAWDDGAGPMSACTVSVGDSSSATAYTSATNILQAPGATVFQDTALWKSTTKASRAVTATFTSTGSNFGITASTITAATNAATVELTSTAHGLQTGNTITISGATGNWTPINGSFTATRTGADTFTIPVNSTTFGALTGSPVIGAKTFLAGGSLTITICTVRRP